MDFAPAARAQCTCTGCGKATNSTRVCPTCVKHGLPEARFCSAECFKASWKEHKVIHVSRPRPSFSTTHDPFPESDYTGTLRACYPNKMSPMRDVPERIPRPDYARDALGMSKSERQESRTRNIKILSAEEIEGMRRVCKLAREVLDLTAAAIRPGITTAALDELVHDACIERDSYPSPLNYRQFPKSVCTSVNEVICHGIPDERPLERGDIVNLDVTLFHKGFHGDLNATYPVGPIDEDSRRLITTTREAVEVAITSCKSGMLFRDIGEIIEPYVKARGCSVNRTYVGHGIRDLFHCAPNIPHYAKNKAIGTMKPGMEHVLLMLLQCFTIEPMVNLGRGDKEHHWRDNWTAVTIDGKRSAQFESTILITERGVENLTGSYAPIPNNEELAAAVDNVHTNGML